MDSTPEQVAETILRVELDNSIPIDELEVRRVEEYETRHVEQRETPNGLQAYLRGTRIAVRHVAAFLQVGFTAEDIISEGLPQLPRAAVHEAIAYYYDHQDEIDAELSEETPESAYALLREWLTPEQFYQLTRHTKS